MRRALMIVTMAAALALSGSAQQVLQVEAGIPAYSKTSGMSGANEVSGTTRILRIRPRN